jgi:predicted small metal-binding protein
MALPGLHRVQVALDCECGTNVEACDDDELLDELLEHIAAAHEAALRRDPETMLTEAYEA